MSDTPPELIAEFFAWREQTFIAPHRASDPPTCIGCGQAISNPSLIRLGSTSCLDCPPTTRYPMRFTHP